MFGQSKKDKSSEATKSKTLNHNEKFVGEFSDGYFFTTGTDGLVRYRSNEEHDAHIKSLEFVEPEPEPPVRNFFDRRQ